MLQKQFQRDNLILCDVLTCRDSALRKFQPMENCPYPGKREFALSTANAESDSNSTERRQRVGTGNRSSETIRVENCADGIQFLVRTTARGAE